MAGEVISESKSRFKMQYCGEILTSSNPLGIREIETSGESMLNSGLICRQFWKAGNYDYKQASKLNLPKGTGRLSVHPKFLHSNATSHKWPFGAIAELVDNVVDEVQNGATFVVVDRILNPRDESPALLIQDNGGGMDPEAMLHCLSFGFSDKNSKISIGHYGNGFKTSTMRLGSDVIVFSRHTKNRKTTQSIGLLSYTFLMQTGHDKIVVPMVDYEFNAETSIWTSLNDAQHDSSNLSLLLQWSPYSKVENLLNQFDDIGSHGTKIVIYNLWHSNDNKMELDFESDPLDICISGAEETKGKSSHLADRLRTSLRAYLSILYLKIPENFSILLRGQKITCHNIVSDLQYPECILYTPHSDIGFQKAQVYTTIGFLKEAPHIKVHGFNIYHKNRLILPFWSAIASCTRIRGRGVVGVLEANFIQPTHNKQDFEKTPVFQKLEHRLNVMTFEYWNRHCGLLGYQVKTKPKITAFNAQPEPNSSESYVPSNSLPDESNIAGSVKRKEHHRNLLEPEAKKKQAGLDLNVIMSNQEIPLANVAGNELDDELISLAIEENKKLRVKCLEHERIVKGLDLKVIRLMNEIKDAVEEYDRLYAELRTKR